MGQARLKAQRREERAELAKAREANPAAGELPAPEGLGPEQVEYWQAQVEALRQRLAQVLTEGRPDIQLRVEVPAPGQVSISFAAGTITDQLLVTADGARQMAAMIVDGADQADEAAQGPPDLATPPPGLWTPNGHRGPGE